LFTASAELYDAIYFAFKDYAAEAADIAKHIRSLHPKALTLLDVACGTGEHAKLLATQHDFKVDGLDFNADFLRLARSKHPAGRFFEADMTNFNLNRNYDAVICMFSSIGYVKSLPALEQTLRCFARHLAPDGILIVEPWFPPEKMTSGQHSQRIAEAQGLRVERIGTTDIDGRICRLRFNYTIEKAGQIQKIAELHELGLFTEAETLKAFTAAGLHAHHEAPSPTHRGLYIAHLHPHPN
jgi:ubiquinone/menaquinone biosynthesis C-methylase UbiE